MVGQAVAGGGRWGGSGGGGWSAQDARQCQGQRQADVHSGVGPSPPGGHGAQAPAPRGACWARWLLGGPAPCCAVEEGECSEVCLCLRCPDRLRPSGSSFASVPPLILVGAALAAVGPGPGNPRTSLAALSETQPVVRARRRQLLALPTPPVLQPGRCPAWTRLDRPRGRSPARPGTSCARQQA